MKKNKKNKKAAKKATLLGGAAKSLKKLSKGSVGKLSTTQKVIAGTALGALGVRYLVKQLNKSKAAASADSTYSATTQGFEGAEEDLNTQVE